MESSNKTILAKEYSLKEILADKKYIVDYFQREYTWEKLQIEQLVEDLTNSFFDDYKVGDTPKNVANYNTYYMGSIVLSDKRNGISSIIDGQQRITSLTLLLIYLLHKTNNTMRSQIDNLIYSDSYGEKSFNIQVPEREICLKALYDCGDYEPTDLDDESTINMANRYKDIVEAFPEDSFGEDVLKSFVYWLLEKVILVKITATSEDNAYTIFETMNNRGKSLKPSDMLKGFILSKFNSDDQRKVMNNEWKSEMQKLKEISDDTDNQFFQSWLRSQYAETIRQSKQGSINMDFENIGTRFHNWFKDNYSKGLLAKSINGDIEKFMKESYHFYLKYFMLIKSAEQVFDKSLEHVYYHQHWGISPSLSYPLYLAPLNITDDDTICRAKINLVAHHLEGFAVRRAINYKLFSASSIRYTMCSLVRTIRGLDLATLKVALVESISEEEAKFDFTKVSSFRLHMQNGRFVKFYLSRLTSFIEDSCGQGSNYVRYMTNPDCKPYEIEHIWSDHPEWHTDEFTDKSDFADARNTIGDLLLLPNGINQSLNDMEWKNKIPHYIKENILASSLCQELYNNNPSFNSFIKKNYLPFKEYTSCEFKFDAIKERCILYQKLSELMWNKDLNFK
jgi:uncharacterized protein with ParB-like and HNH nuclease domain